jgi:hypothetical protein
MQAPSPRATTPEIATYLDFIPRHDCNGDARSYVSDSGTRAVGNRVFRLYEEPGGGAGPKGEIVAFYLLIAVEPPQKTLRCASSCENH